MINITPTDEQYKGIKLIKKWFNNSNDFFVLAGLAGTGKTSLLPVIIDELGLQFHQVKFCSFTGKAASVLRKKGLPATTIHKLIYEPVIEKNKKVHFIKKLTLGNNVKLICVDESSMVGKVIQRDLESFGIPVLYIGDYGQLPPVTEDVTNLMLSPTYKLETIHRQALDNPIIWIANQIRLGKYVDFGKYGDKVLKTRKENLNFTMLTKVNQIICGLNKTRINMNKSFRTQLGFESIYPEINDKLICKKNNNQNGLVNGMTGVCNSFNSKNFKLTFENDEGDIYSGLIIDKHIFNGTKSEKYNKNIEMFDYGYCLTAHSAQGSQWEKVIVIEEQFGDNDFHAKWLYTAVTRAEDKLIILV